MAAPRARRAQWPLLENITVVRSIAVRLAAAIAMAMPWGVHASEYSYDPHVFAFLPEWCKYTPLYYTVAPGGKNYAQIERWNRIMGPQNFKHLHHYCRALFYTVRGTYFERTKAGREYALAHSLGEYDYVIQRVEESFALLPEILTKKGETLVLLERAEAIAPLHRAIDLKPDYWPAYAALSDYFRKMGNVEQARQWLQRGLDAAPQAKPLARRLAELDSRGRSRGESVR